MFKQWIFLLVLLGFFAGFSMLGCFSSNEPERSFDEIEWLVAEKNAAEVLGILGEPDSRTEVFGGERWVWWRFTFLEGPDYPPEDRGHVGHLEIFFRQQPNRSGVSVTPLERLEVDRDTGPRFLPSRKSRER